MGGARIRRHQRRPTPRSVSWVGPARPEDLEFIALTESALDAGIAAAVVGNKIGDISYAIGSVAQQQASASAITDDGPVILTRRG